MVEINCNEIIDNVIRTLKLVPEFDGTPNTLIRFLALCDKLVLTYVNPSPGYELSNLATINGILNKITGAAARTISLNGIPQDWNSIRNTLINCFSDHRDETTLYTDLSQLTQGSDTPHVFYERIQNLLSYIITYVELHDNLITTVESKRTLYTNLALKTYLRGLHEPLGSRIRCMRPSTLEKALEYVQEEMNVLYLQSKKMPTPNFYTKNQTSFNTPFNFDKCFVSNIPHNQPHFTNPQILNRPRPIFSGPSRTQQMFRALPRSNMSTGFKIPPRQSMLQPKNNYPRPMSGISYPVARPLPTRIPHDWRIHGNPPPSNYFKTREVNANEFYEQNPYYDEYHYDYPNYECTEYQEYDQTPTEEVTHDNTNQSQNFPEIQQQNAPE